MGISFIISSSKQNFKPFRNQMLGVLYLMTILEYYFKDKIDLSLIDLRSVSLSDVIYHIPERDLYFYSVTSLDYPDIKRIVEDIRNFYPDSKHVAGGPHINIFQSECLEVFDAIVLGEGEESIKRVVNDFFKGELKRVYNQQEIIDINSYPYPLRKFLPKSAVVDKGLLTKKYSDLLGTTALFSRGCPFNCHFCANLNKGSLRLRSPELIIKEIEYLKEEYKIEALAIKDDQSIPVNPKIALPFLESIKRTKIKWRGQSRANGVNKDLIRLAKESGCIEIAVGVESVSQNVLNIINKGISINIAKKYLKDLMEEGLDRRLLLMTGLPGEPDDIVEQTIKFIKESKPSTVLLSFFCPLPGSKMYESPRSFGIKINPNVLFDEYMTAFGRFDKDEKPTPVFEYEEKTPFGRGKSIDERIQEYIKIQDFLRDNNLNF